MVSKIVIGETYHGIYHFYSVSYRMYTETVSPMLFSPILYRLRLPRIRANLTDPRIEIFSVTESSMHDFEFGIKIAGVENCKSYAQIVNFIKLRVFEHFRYFIGEYQSRGRAILRN